MSPCYRRVVFLKMFLYHESPYHQPILSTPILYVELHSYRNFLANSCNGNTFFCLSEIIVGTLYVPI
jgi:hypothetical protein